MRIPETFRKCVVFLGRVRTDEHGEEQALFGGTGFIVAVPGPLDANRYYLYLVTAKHVVDGLAGSEWVVRANGADGQIHDFKASLRRKWWFHPSEKDVTDVAVTHFEGANTLDYTNVLLGHFLDESQISDNGIGAGDEVFMVGLFTRMRGRQKMLPLVRMGNVAMIPGPGELVPAVKIGTKIVAAEAYLIEARSIGGLSGSPVFVQETVAMPIRTVERGQPGTKQLFTRIPGSFFLFGLVNGHWEVDPDEKNYPDPRRGQKDDAVNMGIAVVVPAKKIKETLYHPELVALREFSDREAKSV